MRRRAPSRRVPKLGALASRAFVDAVEKKGVDEAKSHGMQVVMGVDQAARLPRFALEPARQAVRHQVRAEDAGCHCRGENKSVVNLKEIRPARPRHSFALMKKAARPGLPTRICSIAWNAPGGLQSLAAHRFVAGHGLHRVCQRGAALHHGRPDRWAEEVARVT